jgi:hypothetical protein
MAIEYDVLELTSGRPVLHGTLTDSKDAETLAANLRDKTGNNFMVSARFVPGSEAIQNGPVSAREIYAEVHGPAASFDEAPYRTRLLYELLAEAANEVLSERRQIDVGGIS